MIRKNLDLKTGPGGRLARLYFLEHGADVLLLYEVTDGRAGWAYLTMMDQTTAKAKWITPVNAIDVGVSVVEEESAYITATNFVARIDLVSVKRVWELKDFNPNQNVELRFVDLTPASLVLREDQEPGREIEIDKKIGQVVETARRASPKN